MQFSKIFLVAAAAAVASAGYANTTVTEIGTTVITITSCSGHSVCTEVPVTTGLTTVTETVKGTKTIYTTYCPLPSETKSTVPVSSSAPVSSSVTSASSKAPVSSSTKASNTTVPQVSTANGANQVALGLGSAAALAGLLLF